MSEIQKMAQFLGSRAQQDSVMALNKWSGGSELEVGAGGGTGGAHYDG